MSTEDRNEEVSAAAAGASLEVSIEIQCGAQLYLAYMILEKWLAGDGRAVRAILNGPAGKPAFAGLVTLALAGAAAPIHPTRELQHVLPKLIAINWPDAVVAGVADPAPTQDERQ